MTPLDMTDQQIREAISAMRAAEKEKAALLDQALVGGPNARFVVFGLMLRQRGVKQS